MLSIEKHIEIFNREIGWARNEEGRNDQRAISARNRSLQECYRQIAYIMMQDMEKGRSMLSALDSELCY